MEALRDAQQQAGWLGLRPSELVTERRRAAMVLAAVLFAAIFAARATVGTLGDATSFLYVIPVVLIATSRGTRAGLLAGAVAFALSSAGTLIMDLPAFERTLGYGPQELVGRPFLDFVHPDDRELTEREAAGVSDGNGTVQFRNRYLDKAGDVRWLEWMSAPMPDRALIYAVARDVTDRVALEQELERLSQHDALTGLFNRHRFEEELRRQLAYTRRYGNGGALLMIDPDRFKQVNDELGHAAGDRALCEVARVLNENLRASDTAARNVDSSTVVARLGGDEFVVVLPEADEAGAVAAAERLVAALRDSSLEIDGRPVELHVSVGIALFDEYGRPGEQDLLAGADRAMYLTKAGGGDGATLATSPA